jgi:thiol-disulfide isomerase/thioredoxin
VVALAAAVAVTLTFTLGGGSGTAEAGVARLTGPMPEMVGETLSGARLDATAFRGRALVVNFWNPYCTPCRAEATVLDVAHGALRASPVTMVGVLFSNASFPHDLPAAQRFASELGEQYPTIDDPGGTLATAFGVRGIPTTVIADARGNLRYEILGPVKTGQVERLVRRVLRS